jgi:hypothetical protein
MNVKDRDLYIKEKLEDIKGVLSAAIGADPDISLLKVEAYGFILNMVVKSGEKDSLSVVFRPSGYYQSSRDLKVTFGDYGNKSSLRESKVGWTEPKRIKQIIDKAKKHLAVEREQREARERRSAQRQALQSSRSTLREEFPEGGSLLSGGGFYDRTLSLKLTGDEEYMRKVLKALTDADLLGKG